MSSAGRGLGLLALALITVATIAVGSTAAPGRSGAQAGSMHNCPPAAKWSIGVWEGASGTAAADALAACGEGSVAAAYSLDPQSGAWSRWFAGKPDVSNLAPMGEMQGVLALGGTAAAAAAGGDLLVAAQAAGQFHNCPPAGKWSIASWEGASGTEAADALAACGDDAVAAAYSLDAQTGAWSRWFAGKPDVSNLAPLGDMQGVLALGSSTGPVATPGSGTPTPEPTATPAATPTGTPSVDVELSQDCYQAWTVAETLEMLVYAEEQAGLPTAYVEAVLQEQDDFIQENCMSPSVAPVPDPASETVCADATALALGLAIFIDAAESEGVPHIYFSQQVDQLSSFAGWYCQ